MKDINTSSKILASIALITGALWLGTYTVRLTIMYTLFEETELVLRSFVSNQNLPGILETIASVINLTFVLYILFIISFSLFLIVSKVNIKENGWLFIISVIIYFTMPFEIYLMTIDYKLIINLNFSEMNPELAINLIKDRLEKLSSFPVILVLSYLTIPVFLIFKPFNKRQKLNET